MKNLPPIEPWMIEGRRIHFASTTIRDMGFSDARESVVMLAEDCETSHWWAFFPQGGRRWEYHQLPPADAGRALAGAGFYRSASGLHSITRS